jgi:N utilization substance protein B
VTGMGTRRRAREFALQILYQLDVQDQLSDVQAIALFWNNFQSAVEPSSSAATAAELGEAQPFAEHLVRGVRAHLGEIDSQIQSASRNWRLERMARVDRNLLRLALYELKYADDVPAKVAINEAIEIAKRFGTSESSAFVNGILDRCREELGKK